jgi:hypothetical protein
VSLGDNLKDILETKDRKNLQQRLKMENLNLSKINPSRHIDKQMFLARVVAQKSIKKDGRPVQQKVHYTVYYSQPCKCHLIVIQVKSTIR